MHAVSQLHDACDVVLQRLYEFPEPERVAAIQKSLKARREAREAEEAAAAASDN